MLKKTITYDNLFTEEKVTEDHYFHISKADMVEMEMEEHKDEYTPKNGGEKLTGIQAKLQRIVDSEDGKAIMAEFKDMIRRSYGKKDGDRFLKSPEIAEEFMGSEAFSQLLWDICTDASQAAEFINGIFPGNLEQITAEVQERAAQIRAEQTRSTRPERLERLRAIQREEEATALGTDDSTGALVDRLEAATAENPVVLTTAEATAMDADELQSGLVTGRYKLS